MDCVHLFQGLGKPAVSALMLFALGFTLIATGWFTQNQFKMDLTVSVYENERRAQDWMRVQYRLTMCVLVGMFCLIAGNVGLVYMVLYTVQSWFHERREKQRETRVAGPFASDTIEYGTIDKSD